MSNPLRVLIVEDSEDDAQLVLRELRRSGYDPVHERVESAATMSSALVRQAWEVVISDYNIPNFDSLAALAMMKERGHDLPFIIVSGSITEETAVGAMKAGAHDYIMKGNLARLGPAVAREIREMRERRRAINRQAAQVAVSHALAESVTLGEAAPRLLQAVCTALGWEVGEIWLIDQSANVLRCETIWHIPSVNAGEFATTSRQITFSHGVGLPGRVWSTGEPAWITDVALDPNFPRARAAAAISLHGAFAFPIKVGGEFRGVVEIFSRLVQQPDNDLVQMMADIGLKIGEFIHRHTLQEQFRQAQKMEAVGRLAGGITHDFNNLLTVILGYCQLLLDRARPDDPIRHEVGEIRTAGERAASLTRQLLAFSRRQVFQPQVLDLNEQLASIETMLRRLIGEDVSLSTFNEPDLGRILADPGQIHQVIMNLAVNARDAMPQGGTLTIQTSNIVYDRPQAGERMTIPPGRYVMIAVTDTGVGMDADTKARLFEPFFTTKEPGKGTGLGLSTVYGIVKQSGGVIEVQSEPGRGTTFKIFLPSVQAKAELVTPPPADVQDLCGSETVLVVEDEAPVRKLIRTVLERHGYTTLVTHDAQEALQICESHQGQIHVLLTDTVLPGMNGRELAERVLRMLPQIKVVYMSGYTDKVLGQMSVLDLKGCFLQKPFTPEMLPRKIREALAS